MPNVTARAAASSIAKRVLAIRAAFGRDSERRYPVNRLALGPERFAACGDHAYCRIGTQQRIGQARRCVDHMLAIVEHNHDLLRTERVRRGLRRCRARNEFKPECGGDGDRDEVRIGQRRQLGGPDPIGERRQLLSCDLEAKPRLADASGAGQGDQAVGGAKAQDLGQLGVTADQFGNLLRQVRGRAGWHGRRFSHFRGRLGIRRRRGGADLSGELVSASSGRADQVAVRREHLAQCRDVDLQIILFDDPAGPNALHQRILADDSAARLDQCHQHVERARSKFHRPIVGKQLASIGQNPETAELDCRRGNGCGTHGN